MLHSTRTDKVLDHIQGSRRAARKYMDVTVPYLASHSLLQLAATACGLGVDSATVHFDCPLGSAASGLAGIRLGVNQAGLDVPCKRKECVLNAIVGLGARFHKLDTKFVRKGTTLFFRNGFLVSPVRFVTNQYLVHALGGVLFNIRVPRADIIEGLFIGNIVHEQNAHGASVVSSSNSAEALLASSIPNLEFDALAVELDGTDLEVDSNSGDEGRGPCVVTEAKQETRFADT